MSDLSLLRNRLVRFSDIGVEPKLVSALKNVGIVEPFEVQKESIPDILLGRDVCCRAPTGSGKTLAFGLPLLCNTKKSKPKRPTSLILTPTRELAEQIRVVLAPLAGVQGHRVMTIYGGSPYKGQIGKLRRGVEIVVACPGRLIDLTQKKALNLNDVDIVVIDEADRMADMGFMDPVCEILDMCNGDRQTVLFSATLDDDVKGLVDKYQVNPVRIEVGPEEVRMDTMAHYFWKVGAHDKSILANHISQTCGSVIVFCKTRAGVDRLGDQLIGMGSSVTTLHGGMNQKQRDRSMRRFGSQGATTLIATDVASRGIDIEGINCVLHFDPPENGKAYKHRSGRTARAGSKGIVISFVQKSQVRFYKKIQRSVGINQEIKEAKPESLDDAFQIIESGVNRKENRRVETRGNARYPKKRTRRRRNSEAMQGQKNVRRPKSKSGKNRNRRPRGRK